MKQMQGFFQFELINPLLEAIKNDGHDWVWVGDEFGTERRLENVKDLWKSDKLNSESIQLIYPSQ